VFRSATRENYRKLEPEKPTRCRVFRENRTDQAVVASGHQTVGLVGSQRRGWSLATLRSARSLVASEFALPIKYSAGDLRLFALLRPGAYRRRAVRAVSAAERAWSLK
jgi:hypothetical protein